MTSPEDRSNYVIFKAFARCARFAARTFNHVRTRLKAGLAQALRLVLAFCRFVFVESAFARGMRAAWKYVSGLLPGWANGLVIAILVAIFFALLNLISFANIGSYRTFEIMIGRVYPSEPEMASILHYRDNCEIADPEYWSYLYFLFWSRSERECRIVWSMYLRHQVLVDNFEKRKNEASEHERKKFDKCDDPFIINPECKW